MSRRSMFLPAAVAMAVIAVSGCSTSSPSSKDDGGPTILTVAASINAWGSVVAQLGGTHVDATSIITSPDTDPHDYEPTPADGRRIADSQLFVENGVGYDSWAAQSLEASPDSSRLVVDVGQVTGTPDDGNPHRWYSPSDVEKIADTITADLKQLDPADAEYFDSQRKAFEDTGLAEYHQVIADIKSTYGGTPVGASESIFAPLSDALGLDLVTPASFLKAVSEGTDPSAADKATIDDQISGGEIAVYVFNTQNATPDVTAQVDACKQQGIPVTGVTETLSPEGASFQDWQVAQLRSLEAALKQAAGR